MTYYFDNNPIELNDGGGIFFPNNMLVYFIYKNLNSNIFSLNILTEKVKFESFINLNEKSLDNTNIMERIT